ncbi:LPP20 family lipoprotein [Caminibacter sp.]
MKRLIFLAAAISIGCASNQMNNEICSNNPLNHSVECKKVSVMTIEGTGEGVAPANAVSMPQAKAMARRAAILDAYKSLAEKIYGVKVNGKDSVRNLILQNSTLRAYVNGIIRGASIEEESFKDGIYYVQMSVKIDSNIWNKLINNN